MWNVVVASSRALWVCLLVCTTAALAEGPAAARSLSAADEQAIRQLMKDQETAWNKHDMMAFTKPLRDDAEGINVVGMYWSGKAAIVKHLVAFHATFLKDCDEYIDEMQIHPIDPTHAIVVSIWRVSAFKGPGGEVIPACRHRDTSVLVKEKDGWKVVHFHNTTIDEAKVAAPGGPAGK
jgi:uncharacterized protein (TIGR02246 family)